MNENYHVHFDDKTLQRERTKESMGSRKKSAAEKEADIESVWSDEPYGLEERDFKKKQVRDCRIRESQRMLLTSVDLQRMDSTIPCISINGCDLRRYRHESSICLLVNIQLCALER